LVIGYSSGGGENRAVGKRVKSKLQVFPQNHGIDCEYTVLLIIWMLVR